MTRRLLIAVAVVALVAAAVPVGRFVSRMRFDANSRAQARAATHDGVWRTALLPGSREHFRHTGLADAAWLPRVLRSTPKTTVQRSFAFTVAPPEVLTRWDEAAMHNGWAFAKSSCNTFGKPELTYSKMVGNWPAVLTINLDYSEYIDVVLRLPDEPAARAEDTARIPTCG
jgi:hypothetical protein